MPQITKCDRLIAKLSAVASDKVESRRTVTIDRDEARIILARLAPQAIKRTPEQVQALNRAKSRPAR